MTSSGDLNIPFCLGIDYNICLARMIANFTLVVIQQLHPYSLPHVELFLIEDMLKTFVIGEDSALFVIEVVPLDL